MSDKVSTVCDFYWGSHGCDLPLAHLGAHQCGDAQDPCSQFDEFAAVARYRLFDADTERDTGEWSEWMPNPYGFRV